VDGTGLTTAISNYAPFSCLRNLEGLSWTRVDLDGQLVVLIELADGVSKWDLGILAVRMGPGHSIKDLAQASRLVPRSFEDPGGSMLTLQRVTVE
jgi:hypothetical protein